MSKKGKVLLIFAIAIVLLVFALKMMGQKQETKVQENPNQNQVEHTYHTDSSDFSNIDEGDS
jgi:Tfp pilus assembly protein PilO